MAVVSDADDLLAANENYERQIRRQWDHVLEWLKGQWSITELEAMVTSRQFHALITDLTKGAEALAAVVADAYIASGKLGAATVTRAIHTPITFEGNNERAVGYLRRDRLRLVREVTDAQRGAWTEAIAAGMQRGDNPRVIAREIRASLGLTAKQQNAVENYRRLLRENSAEALTRELRDRRFDPSVRRAIMADRPLGNAEIEKLVDRYRQRYINYRAEVIARTEALRAVHLGAEEAYQQAIDAGDLKEQEVERTWVIAGGVNRKGKRRTRDSHRAMSGQKRGLGQAFRSGYGYPLKYPGDIDAPASETVQCRCAVTTRLVPGRVSPAVTAAFSPDVSLASPVAANDIAGNDERARRVA